MKTTRIVFSLPASVTDRLKPFIDEATRSRGKASFVFQVYDNGIAKGLYLDKNDTPIVAKIFRKIFAGAESVKLI